jgi:hypothetical protein
MFHTKLLKLEQEIRRGNFNNNNNNNNNKSNSNRSKRHKGFIIESPNQNPFWYKRKKKEKKKPNFFLIKKLSYLCAQV